MSYTHPIRPLVGRRYKTRSGSRVQCVFDVRFIVADRETEPPMVCVALDDGDVLTYHDDGRFFADGRDGMLDIMECIDQ